MKLVIVESPAKAKTIQSYLGSKYKVIATMGHVRNLIPKKDSVVFENNKLELKWQLNNKKIDPIFACINQIDEILIATDPDREGEAIGWHIETLLKTKVSKPIYRIVFAEINKKAIVNAIDHKRLVDQNLVNAYLARLVLDHQLGFSLSPLIWLTFSGLKNVSAGRVQLPLLGLIFEREKEIKYFNKEKFYTITWELDDFKVKYEAELDLLEELSKEDKLIVQNIKESKGETKTFAPYITSTLQQDMYLQGFSVDQTMRVAQKLYEGIEIKGQSISLITYMRTDSVNMSKEAIDQIRDFLNKNYTDIMSDKPNLYKQKVKNAQEAHECIRIIDPYIIPESIKEFISNDEFKLYNAIWKRSLASQCINDTKLNITVNFQKKIQYKTSIVTKPGFGLLYGIKEEKKPEFKEKYDIKNYIIEENFTKPKPRFNDGSLVKNMVKTGIGRPSTYAKIIETIKIREYIQQFYLSIKGGNIFLLFDKYFNIYTNTDFTQKVEDSLDDIAQGKVDYLKVIGDSLNTLNTLISSFNPQNRTEILKEYIDIFPVYCNCGNLGSLKYKYSFFFVCDKCEKIISEEKQIGNYKLYIMDTFAYVIVDGKKIYIPKDTDKEDKIEKLIQKKLFNE